jgi:hypothetical integral membrane protein (TIGR02206 family)
MDQDPVFVLFGSAHLLTLALIAGLGAALSQVPRADSVTPLAWVMAVLLLAQEAVKQYIYVGIDGLDWRHFLPLHICRVNEFVCAFMLVRRSYRAFEVAYFWAMGGSVVALLTPDLAQGFPDPRFLIFFLGHALLVFAALYAVFAYGFRPRLQSVGIALAVTAVYALVVAGVNVLLGANYLFLCAKPAGASIMDFLGPWPIYLVGLFSLVAVICFLCYLPFALTRRPLSGRRSAT